MSKRYENCDRCGEELEYNPELIDNHILYANALLCLKCAGIRRFDDENPILYRKENQIPTNL